MRLFTSFFLFRGAFNKKTKFFADIGIFLIFFAVISSAISVYFESKIDNLEEEINKEKAKEFIFRDWRRSLLPDLLYLEKQEIYYKLFLAEHKKEETFNNYYQGEISYELNYCLNILNLTAGMPYTLQYAIKDLRNVASDKDLSAYNIDSIEKEINEFLELYSDEKYPTMRDMCEEEGTEKIYSFHKNNIKIVLIFIKFFNELKNESNNKLFSNYELINDYFRMSTRYIFIAFIFQLLIFILIQFFELRVSNQEDE